MWNICVVDCLGCDVKILCFGKLVPVQVPTKFTLQIRPLGGDPASGSVGRS